MNTLRTQVVQSLEVVPDDRLGEVLDFLNYLVRPQANPQTQQDRDLTFPVIFFFERSPNFSLSQSLILSSAIVIKSSLLKTAKSLKPSCCRHFQT